MVVRVHTHNFVGGGMVLQCHCPHHDVLWVRYNPNGDPIPLPDYVTESQAGPPLGYDGGAPEWFSKAFREGRVPK